jgi:hypothetical protein
MRVNTGGSLGPEEVIGRDELIMRLWDVLQRQSVVLGAERRMGKTQIVRKMTHEAPGGILAIYRELENVVSPAEFVERILDDVQAYLPQHLRAKGWLRELWGSLGGAELGGLFKIPEAKTSDWKRFLEQTLAGLVSGKSGRLSSSGTRCPLMLDNIKRRAGEDTAMEVLDTLRGLRQTHPKLRMVFTGSIGLHHVVTSLKRSGYANAPTNDMHIEEVLPLAPDDAGYLAEQLLIGEDIEVIPVADRALVARRIADVTDRVPFFIHHLVGALRTTRRVESPADVDGAMDRLLDKPQDPMQLSYYRERIDKYYRPEERPLALGLLDALAVEANPLPFEDVFNRLKARLATEDRDAALAMLTLLQRDHYLLRERGAYRFQFPLIARTWRRQRGLEA